MENKEIMLRFADYLDNSSKVLEKLSNALYAIINNNNSVVDNISRLNVFASDVYNKFNNTLMVIDALSVCLFEKKIIEEERFQAVLEELAKRHEEQLRNEKMKECKDGCKGDCGHETKGETDSTGTKSEEVHV